MKCFNCNSRVPEDRNNCPKCGADIRLYRKIIHASNQYYNLGLERARARDLSGAAECLRTSIQLYKKNTNARNLLGLVYYEMGEAAMALKEWVISKNFRHRANPADGYIQELRDNRQSLDSVDHSIHKFNQALEYARSGSRDMAVIQLKKVISVNPRMLKAYQLLALMYMDEQRYDLAKEVIDQCLAIDRGNPAALSYKRELEHYVTDSPAKSSGFAGELEREEVIIPVKMRDYGTYLAAAAYILVGFLLALGVLYYVVMPGKEQEFTRKNAAEIADYEDKYVALNAQINGLETQLEDLRASKDEEISRHEDAEDEMSALADQYRAVLSVAMSFIEGVYEDVPDGYAQLDADATDDPAYQAVYRGIMDQVEGRLPDRMFAQVLLAREKNANRPEAIRLCEEILNIDSGYDFALFYWGLCAQESGDNATAVEKYAEYMTRFPTGIWIQECRTHLQELDPGLLQVIDTTPIVNPPANVEEPEDEDEQAPEENPPAGEEQPQENAEAPQEEAPQEPNENEDQEAGAEPPAA